MKELSLDLKSQQQELEFEAKIKHTAGAGALHGSRWCGDSDGLRRHSLRSR